VAKQPKPKPGQPDKGSGIMPGSKPNAPKLFGKPERVRVKK
jgi:hypothetical protein